MPKQKTPLMELIEYIDGVMGLFPTENTTPSERAAYDAYYNIKCAAEKLLPAERKMVEDAIIDNADIRYEQFGEEQTQATTYFTNKYGS